MMKLCSHDLLHSGRARRGLSSSLGVSSLSKLHEILNRCTLPRINKSPPQPPYQPEAGLIGIYGFLKNARILNDFK